MAERKFYQEGWSDERMESWDFWNKFHTLWGVAQANPGFNHKLWMDVREYIQKLEQEGRLRLSVDAHKPSPPVE
jgi:hypothetical protein